MKASIDVEEIPGSLMSVCIGRVVRIDREPYDKRIVQIQVNYPQDRSGNILRFTFRKSIKKGDRIAVAGRLSNELIKPVLVRNMSAKAEHPSLWEIPLGIRQGRMSLHIENPLVTKARMQIDEALRLHEEQMAEIVTPAGTRQVGASEFEMLVADLFERLGFQNVMIAGGAGDKGVDIEASRVEAVSGKVSRIIVQCKHQSLLNRVMPTQVRDFAHAIQREKQNGVSRGYFVTSSYFSPECFDKENCGDDMELVDRDQLELLLKKAGLPLPVMQ